MNERDLEVFVVRLDERTKAAVEALAVAKAEVDRRLDGMNELRHQIENERRGYVSRAEFDTKIGSIEKNIETLQKVIWGATGALLAMQFILAILMRYWKP